MKVHVLTGLPWDTSRDDTAKFLTETMAQTEDGKFIECYGRHILFFAGGRWFGILFVPGNGNVDADRRPPHLLVDVDIVSDDAAESQFSFAMQDEVRNMRNTIARHKEQNLVWEMLGDAIFPILYKEL